VKPTSRSGLLKVSLRQSTVPHPTAVIVDADGTIRYFRQDVDYKHRPTTVELLEAVAETAPSD